jgi:hypothetical protein
MFVRAILAAVIGTVAMTLSSTTEMQWVERPASVVPDLATAKLLRPFGIKEVKGRALDIPGHLDPLGIRGAVGRGVLGADGTGRSPPGGGWRPVLPDRVGR